MSEDDRERLAERSFRFFSRYGDELENLRMLLEVRLNQLATVYTLDNRLPREAVQVETRVKSLSSFLGKLAELGWPDFYYPTEVVRDLLGARVVCWFVNDCYGMLDTVRNFEGIGVLEDSIEDFIKSPKPSGYRSIHVSGELIYDRVDEAGDRRKLVDDKMICEIQFRTKVQDAWAEFTHEAFYKVPPGDIEDEYNRLVGSIADRLTEHEESAISIRELLRKLYKYSKRRGFLGPRK